MAVIQSDLGPSTNLKARKRNMNWKSKLILGVFTALAMMLLTFALPKGSSYINAAALVQFPVTVGIWAIFVLLFITLILSPVIAATHTGNWAATSFSFFQFFGLMVVVTTLSPQSSTRVTPC